MPRCFWIVALVVLAIGASPAIAGKLTKFKTRAYTVYSDLPRAEAKEIANHMDGVFSEYTRRLAGAGFKARRRTDLPLYLFSRYETYVRFLAAQGIRAENTAGMFFVMPKLQGLAAWTGDQSRIRLYHTLQHEGFHQFAYLRISPNLPIWVNEGLAEYFGYAQLVKRRFVLGQVDQMRLQRLREAIEKNRTLPFTTMINMTGQEWATNVQGGHNIGHLQYAQAWSMVHFLVHAKPAYQKAFMAYLTKVHKGVGSGRAFSQAFGSTDYQPFERAWREYILNLQPDALTTASHRLMFLAQGMKMLRQRNQAVSSIEQLKKELQAVRFRVQHNSSGVTQKYHASNETLFQAPVNTKKKRPTTIRMVPNRKPNLPPEIVISGLEATVKLKWLANPDGTVVEEIVYE